MYLLFWTFFLFTTISKVICEGYDPPFEDSGMHWLDTDSSESLDDESADVQNTYEQEQRPFRNNQHGSYSQPAKMKSYPKDESEKRPEPQEALSDDEHMLQKLLKKLGLSLRSLEPEKKQKSKKTVSMERQQRPKIKILVVPQEMAQKLMKKKPKKQVISSPQRSKVEQSEHATAIISYQQATTSQVQHETTSPAIPCEEDLFQPLPEPTTEDICAQCVTEDTTVAMKRDHTSTLPTDRSTADSQGTKKPDLQAVSSTIGVTALNTGSSSTTSTYIQTMASNFVLESTRVLTSAKITGSDLQTLEQTSHGITPSRKPRSANTTAEEDKDVTQAARSTTSPIGTNALFETTTKARNEPNSSSSTTKPHFSMSLSTNATTATQAVYTATDTRSETLAGKLQSSATAVISGERSTIKLEDHITTNPNRNHNFTLPTAPVQKKLQGEKVIQTEQVPVNLSYAFGSTTLPSQDASRPVRVTYQQFVDSNTSVQQTMSIASSTTNRGLNQKQTNPEGPASTEKMTNATVEPVTKTVKYMETTISRESSIKTVAQVNPDVSTSQTVKETGRNSTSIFPTAEPRKNASSGSFSVTTNAIPKQGSAESTIVPVITMTMPTGNPKQLSTGSVMTDAASPRRPQSANSTVDQGKDVLGVVTTTQGTIESQRGIETTSTTSKMTPVAVSSSSIVSTRGPSSQKTTGLNAESTKTMPATFDSSKRITDSVTTKAAYDTQSYQHSDKTTVQKQVVTESVNVTSSKISNFDSLTQPNVKIYENSSSESTNATITTVDKHSTASKSKVKKTTISTSSGVSMASVSKQTVMQSTPAQNDLGTITSSKVSNNPLTNSSVTMVKETLSFPNEKQITETTVTMNQKPTADPSYGETASITGKSKSSIFTHEVTTSKSTASQELSTKTDQRSPTQMVLDISNSQKKEEPTYHSANTSSAPEPSTSSTYFTSTYNARLGSSQSRTESAIATTNTIFLSMEASTSKQSSISSRTTEEEPVKKSQSANSTMGQGKDIPGMLPTGQGTTESQPSVKSVLMSSARTESGNSSSLNVQTAKPYYQESSQSVQTTQYIAADSTKSTVTQTVYVIPNEKTEKPSTQTQSTLGQVELNPSKSGNISDSSRTTVSIFASPSRASTDDMTSAASKSKLKKTTPSTTLLESKAMSTAAGTGTSQTMVSGNLGTSSSATGVSVNTNERQTTTKIVESGITSNEKQIFTSSSVEFVSTGRMNVSITGPTVATVETISRNTPGQESSSKKDQSSITKTILDLSPSQTVKEINYRDSFRLSTVPEYGTQGSAMVSSTTSRSIATTNSEFPSKQSSVDSSMATETVLLKKPQSANSTVDQGKDIPGMQTRTQTTTESPTVMTKTIETKTISYKQSSTESKPDETISTVKTSTTTSVASSTTPQGTSQMSKQDTEKTRSTKEPQPSKITQIVFGSVTNARDSTAVITNVQPMNETKGTAPYTTTNVATAINETIRIASSTTRMQTVTAMNGASTSSNNRSMESTNATFSSGAVVDVTASQVHTQITEKQKLETTQITTPESPDECIDTLFDFSEETEDNFFCESFSYTHFYTQPSIGTVKSESPVKTTSNEAQPTTSTARTPSGPLETKSTILSSESASNSNPNERTSMGIQSSTAQTAQIVKTSTIQVLGSQSIDTSRMISTQTASTSQLMNTTVSANVQSTVKSSSPMVQSSSFVQERSTNQPTTGTTSMSHGQSSQVRSSPTMSSASQSPSIISTVESSLVKTTTKSESTTTTAPATTETAKTVLSFSQTQDNARSSSVNTVASTVENKSSVIPKNETLLTTTPKEKMDTSSATSGVTNQTTAIPVQASTTQASSQAIKTSAITDIKKSTTQMPEIFISTTSAGQTLTTVSKEKTSIEQNIIKSTLIQVNSSSTAQPSGGYPQMQSSTLQPDVQMVNKSQQTGLGGASANLTIVEINGRTLLPSTINVSNGRVTVELVSKVDTRATTSTVAPVNVTNVTTIQQVITTTESKIKDIQTSKQSATTSKVDQTVQSSAAIETLSTTKQSTALIGNKTISVSSVVSSSISEASTAFAKSTEKASSIIFHNTTNIPTQATGAELRTSIVTGSSTPIIQLPIVSTTTGTQTMRSESNTVSSTVTREGTTPTLQVASKSSTLTATDTIITITQRRTEIPTKNATMMIEDTTVAKKYSSMEITSNATIPSTSVPYSVFSKTEQSATILLERTGVSQTQTSTATSKPNTTVGGLVLVTEKPKYVVSTTSCTRTSTKSWSKTSEAQSASVTSASSFGLGVTQSTMSTAQQETPAPKKDITTTNGNTKVNLYNSTIQNVTNISISSVSEAFTTFPKSSEQLTTKSVNLTSTSQAQIDSKTSTITDRAVSVTQSPAVNVRNTTSCTQTSTKVRPKTLSSIEETSQSTQNFSRSVAASSAITQSPYQQVQTSSLRTETEIVNKTQLTGQGEPQKIVNGTEIQGQYVPSSTVQVSTSSTGRAASKSVSTMEVKMPTVQEYSTTKILETPSTVASISTTQQKAVATEVKNEQSTTRSTALETASTKQQSNSPTIALAVKTGNVTVTPRPETTSMVSKVQETQSTTESTRVIKVREVSAQNSSATAESVTVTGSTMQGKTSLVSVENGTTSTMEPTKSCENETTPLDKEAEKYLVEKLATKISTFVKDIYRTVRCLAGCDDLKKKVTAEGYSKPKHHEGTVKTHGKQSNETLKTEVRITEYSANSSGMATQAGVQRAATTEKPTVGSVTAETAATVGKYFDQTSAFINNTGSETIAVFAKEIVNKLSLSNQTVKETPPGATIDKSIINNTVQAMKPTAGETKNAQGQPISSASAASIQPPLDQRLSNRLNQEADNIIAELSAKRDYYIDPNSTAAPKKTTFYETQRQQYQLVDNKPIVTNATATRNPLTY